MRRLLLVPLSLALATFPGHAVADAKAECLALIDQIKAELAKHPPSPRLEQLQAALDAAEPETFEADWDECLGVLQDAKKTLRD
jgi:hypothetical protein